MWETLRSISTLTFSSFTFFQCRKHFGQSLHLHFRRSRSSSVGNTSVNLSTYILVVYFLPVSETTRSISPLTFSSFAFSQCGKHLGQSLHWHFRRSLSSSVGNISVNLSTYIFVVHFLPVWETFRSISPLTFSSFTFFQCGKHFGQSLHLHFRRSLFFQCGKHLGQSLHLHFRRSLSSSVGNTSVKLLWASYLAAKERPNESDDGLHYDMKITNLVRTLRHEGHELGKNNSRGCSVLKGRVLSGTRRCFPELAIIARL